jgi:undecaprenyl-diphosphatase
VNELDVQVFRALHGALGGPWLLPMIVLSAFGGGWGSLSVVPLLAWTRTRRFAVSLAAVLGTTALAVYLLKRVVGRVRPCHGLSGIEAVDPPTDFSFPSGHTAGSFAFAVFVGIVLVKALPSDAPGRQLFARRLGAVLLVVFAVGVGLSRIALGVHFPGDVLAGAAVGAAIATVGAQRFLGARDRSIKPQR